MNVVNLIGRPTKEIETVEKGEMLMARFTLAVQRNKDQADFISCVAFNQTAEILDTYVDKGRQVGVTGHIQTGSYEKDGVTHYTTDVIVDRVHLLSCNNDEADNGKKQGYKRTRR